MNRINNHSYQFIKQDQERLEVTENMNTKKVAHVSEWTFTPKLSFFQTFLNWTLGFFSDNYKWKNVVVRDGKKDKNYYLCLRVLSKLEPLKYQKQTPERVPVKSSLAKAETSKPLSSQLAFKKQETLKLYNWIEHLKLEPSCVRYEAAGKLSIQPIKGVEGQIAGKKTYATPYQLFQSVISVLEKKEIIKAKTMQTDPFDFGRFIASCETLKEKLKTEKESPEKNIELAMASYAQFLAKKFALITIDTKFDKYFFKPSTPEAMAFEKAKKALGD